MRKIDDWLIAQVTRAYLWVYDWTGVYVGTILFVESVGHVCLYAARGRGPDWMDFGFLGLNGLFSASLYYEQCLENVESFNQTIEIATRSWGRAALNVMIVVCAISAVCMLDAAYFAQEMFWAILSYTLTIKIRKREPKNFFERQEATSDNRA